ncbi:MAG: ROK family protein [Bacteroidetes bacterium]|nr:ROK family protein [Bacteroidota bacterium]
MEVLGIDIGGTGIKGAPVNIQTGQLMAERFRLPTPEDATPSSIADVVLEIVQHFKWKGLIGCTVPARVEHGLVRTATNIHALWLDTPVEKLLSEKTNCKVTVINDADAAGIASVKFGEGLKSQGLVFFFTVGTGIGSAMFYNQVLIPGTELGHLRLKGDAAELYVSDRTRVNEGLSWKRWASRFQKYLDRIEFLFAPDTIIIGGGVSRPAKVALYSKYLSTRATLLYASLENEAGIIGAACFAGETSEAGETGEMSETGEIATF